MSGPPGQTKRDRTELDGQTRRWGLSPVTSALAASDRPVSEASPTHLGKREGTRGDAAATCLSCHSYFFRPQSLARHFEAHWAELRGRSLTSFHRSIASYTVDGRLVSGQSRRHPLSPRPLWYYSQDDSPSDLLPSYLLFAIVFLLLTWIVGLCALSHQRRRAFHHQPRISTNPDPTSGPPATRLFNVSLRLEMLRFQPAFDVT